MFLILWKKLIKNYKINSCFKVKLNYLHIKNAILKLKERESFIKIID